MDDQDFRLILDALDLSWEGYRKVRKGVKKRITRSLQQAGIRSIHDYLARLEGDPEEKQKAVRLLTVSISRFFRDRELWKKLEEKILPDLVQKEKRELKAWCAGCACGEEAYTLAIIWDSLSESFSTLPPLDILATDINPVYLQKAKKAIYGLSSLKEVPEKKRNFYFKQIGATEKHQIETALTKLIRWKIHDFIHDPVESGFHVIFLRNSLLTYYKETLKRKAFKKITDALEPGGYIIIGSHEKIPGTGEHISRVAYHPHIYVKE